MGSLIIDMLIKIDMEPAEVEALTSSERESLFSEILRSSRYGFHRIVISRALADWVGENVSLNSIEKARLRKLRANYTQVAEQVKKSQFLVIVVGGANVQFLDSGRIVEIGCRWPNFKNILQRSLLLVENANSDGEVFRLILGHEARRLCFGEISFELANGGGASISKELERFVGEGRCVVCICDTDMKVPNGAKSDTCKSMLRQAENLQHIGLAIGTPGAEIENFIPLSIIEEIYGHNKIKECQELEKIVKNQGDCVSGDCFWLYFDIKEGFGKMLPHFNTQDKIEWISRKLKVEPNELDKISISGFGDDVIERFMKNPTLLGKFHQFSRSSYWETHFSEWILRVLWIFCGDKEQKI